MSHFAKQVYFLRPVGERGPIKIGMSVLPRARLRAHQIWSPVLLEIAAMVPAHHNAENWLHRHFLADWIHGEWFKWSERLQEAIDCATANGALPDWVDPPTNPTEYKAFLATYPRGKTKRATQALLAQAAA